MRSIVVGTDGSASADAAVRQTVELAKGRGVSVHVVSTFGHAETVNEPLGGTARRELVDLREVAESLLARAAHEFEAAGVEVQTDAREGNPAAVLIDVATEQQADLIVVGARGRTAVERFLLGSVSSKLVHHAPCSVMVVRKA
jgi:nucleotide-binding universal stress UspA family protein